MSARVVMKRHVRVYRPRFTARRRAAAIAAIDLALAGDIGNDDSWPIDVTREDLKGAREAIDAMDDKWTTGREP